MNSFPASVASTPATQPLEADCRGSSGAETGSEISKPKFVFTVLAMTIYPIESNLGQGSPLDSIGINCTNKHIKSLAELAALWWQKL